MLAGKRKWSIAREVLRGIHHVPVATNVGSGGRCFLDRLRPKVPSYSYRPAQPLESPAPRPRQHETKRRATARFGVARRWPSPALQAAQQVLCYTLRQGGV